MQHIALVEVLQNANVQASRAQGCRAWSDGSSSARDAAMTITQVPIPPVAIPLLITGTLPHCRPLRHEPSLAHLLPRPCHPQIQPKPRHAVDDFEKRRRAQGTYPCVKATRTTMKACSQCPRIPIEKILPLLPFAPRPSNTRDLPFLSITTDPFVLFAFCSTISLCTKHPGRSRIASP